MKRICTMVLTGLLGAVIGGTAFAMTTNDFIQQREAFWQGRSTGDWDEKQQQEEAEIQLKSEMHNLQLAVERWSVDHELSDADRERSWGNNYPKSLSQLLQEHCCSEHSNSKPYSAVGFYPNPFSAGSASELNAMQVPLGWTEDAVGNFSYITQYNELGNVCAYVMIAWGADPTGGNDIDGDGESDGTVLIVAGGEPLDESGMARRHWSEEQREAARIFYYDNGRRIELNWPK
jgi:hypothetical protein